MKSGYIFNKNQSYTSLPKTSPYSKINKARLKNPKFVFRKANLYIRKEFKKPSSWIDIGTGNGEFIFYLANKWKNVNFLGIDATNKFIKVAKKLNKDFENTSFICEDIFKITSNKYKSDIVTCLGTFTIFPNPKLILNKMLNMVNKGGILLIDGRFNPYEISAQIKFKDDKKINNKELWRCDFNLHSEKWIRKILSNRNDVSKIYFKYPIMDNKILKKKNVSDINVWTMPLKSGGYQITNGLKIIISPSFLIIKKK